MPLSAEYVVRETATNLWRNRLMTLAAVLTVAVSLSLVGAALLLKQGVSTAVGYWKGNVDLIVFMKPDATSSQSQAIKTQIAGSPLVKSFTYYDQQRTYQEFRRIFAGQPDYLQVVKAQDLPPSYRLVLQNAADAAEVGSIFSNQPGVLKVDYDRAGVDTMLHITSVLQIVIWAIAAILLMSATVLILNAIRMAIFARRREVAVMKLVGATNWFIRVPFMLEGMVQGVIGAIVAAAAVVGLQHLVSYVIQRAHASLLASAQVPGHDVLVTQVFVLVVGAIVGAGGSAIAVRRFLDV